MNKILHILFWCLLILETGSLFSPAYPSTSAHRRSRKKRTSRRHFKQKRLRKKKQPRKKGPKRSKKLRKRRSSARFKKSRRLHSKRKVSRRMRRKQQADLSRRFQRIQELPPDSISINYAELKVRRMLARSELPQQSHISAFNKIMKTLDRYEENGHVSIPDMERIVSKEINNHC